MSKPKDYAITHKEAKKLPEYIPEDKKLKRPACLRQVSIEDDSASFSLHFYTSSDPDYLWRIKSVLPIKLSKDSNGRYYVDFGRYGFALINVAHFSKSGKKKNGGKTLYALINKYSLDAVVDSYVNNVLPSHYEMLHIFHHWHFKQCEGKFLYHMNLV